MVGSPIGLFLATRRLRPAAVAELLHRLAEKNVRLWNVFHAYDPVAFRIEPMIDQGLRHEPPALAIKIDYETCLPKHVETNTAVKDLEQSDDADRLEETTENTNNGDGGGGSADHDARRGARRKVGGIRRQDGARRDRVDNAHDVTRGELMRREL